MAIIDKEKQAIEDGASSTKPPRPANWFGVRHWQFSMLSIAVIIAYGMRTNMSVGIIAMIDENPPNSDIPTYPDWTQKNIILSSFFWGYIVPQIVAGQLVKKFGPKWFLAGCIFVNSLFCVLIPTFAASFGQGGVIACRVIQGFSQGFIFPSVHNLLGKWTPLPERSFVGSFVYTAGPLGNFISMLVTGVISNSDAGWMAAFYLYGALGMAWSLLWAWQGSNSPEDNKHMSLEERKYIEGTTEISEHRKRPPTPWRDILTSLPVLAVVVSHMGQNWGFWTLLTEIPSYLKNIMGYEIEDNSIMSALPYLVLWVLSLLFSPMADFLIMRRYLSIGATRKVLNTIGLWIPAAALIGLSFVEKGNKELAVALLIVAVGFNSASYSGFNINHIDLSPIHAGTLMGITNSFSNVMSLIAPLVVEAIGIEETNLELWRYVFCIAAGIYIVTNTVFLILGSGEVQPWNDYDSDREGSEPRRYGGISIVGDLAKR